MTQTSPTTTPAAAFAIPQSDITALLGNGTTALARAFSESGVHNNSVQLEPLPEPTIKQLYEVALDIARGTKATHDPIQCNHNQLGDLKFDITLSKDLGLIIKVTNSEDKSFTSSISLNQFKLDSFRVTLNRALSGLQLQLLQQPKGADKLLAKLFKATDSTT